MTKTTNSNYLSATSPGSTFNQRISSDSDTFARNDIDSLGSALDQHTHATGLGLPVVLSNASTGTPSVTNITVGGGVTDQTGGSISVTSGATYFLYALIDTTDTSGSTNSVTGLVRDGANTTIANTNVSIGANLRTAIPVGATFTAANSTLKLSAQALTGNAQLGPFSQIRVVRIG